MLSFLLKTLTSTCFARPVRDDVFELVWFVGVVEDQQPLLVGLAFAERLQCRECGALDALPDGGRQREFLGKTGQGRANQVRLVRRDPPDQVILRTVAMRVLDGQRGFTDSAHALERVQHRDIARYCRPQVVEDLVPAGEVLDPLGDIAPDRRDPGRSRRVRRRHTAILSAILWLASTFACLINPMPYWTPIGPPMTRPIMLRARSLSPIGPGTRHEAARHATVE
jgi:hypothetical protein